MISLLNQINKLDKVLSKLNQKGFKLNAEKSFFARNELEYLGLRITRQGIMPLPDKVNAIKKHSSTYYKKKGQEVLLDLLITIGICGNIYLKY